MAGEAEGARNTEAQGGKVTGHLGEMQGVHFAWCLECERVCRGAGEVGSAADGGPECSAKVYGLELVGEQWEPAQYC